MLSHLRYVFRPEAALGKSHNLLSTNAFKVQGVDFEFVGKVGSKLRPGGILHTLLKCCTKTLGAFKHMYRNRNRPR